MKIKNQIKKRWLRLFPKTLYGRVLLLIIIPILFVQLVSLFVFFHRHWNFNTETFSNHLIKELKAIEKELNENGMESANVLANRLDISMTYLPYTRSVSKNIPNDSTQKVFINQYNEYLRRNKLEKDNISIVFFEPSTIKITIHKNNSTLIFKLNEYKLYSTTTAQLVLYWTIFSGILIGFIALKFTKKQITPIISLSKALSTFGLGDSSQLKKMQTHGSLEVRNAIRESKHMAKRITKHAKQRTKMLSAISHDLRTPLTRISLLLEILDSNDKKNIKEIKNNIEEMNNMISSYLDFTKNNNTNIQDIKNINSYEFLKLLATKWKNAKKHITYTYKEKNVYFNIKTIELTRALDNIINNCFNHGKKVEINVIKKHQHIVILIEDNGPGIPLEKRKKVFQPFVRLDKSRNLDNGGSGLGLTISKDIIISHGGKLEVGNSKLGGALFKITLPIAKNKYI